MTSGEFNLLDRAPEPVAVDELGLDSPSTVSIRALS
jgi:hypothetical protein